MCRSVNPPTGGTGLAAENGRTMSTKTEPHLDGDTIDRYATGRLSEPETETVEMHLLICEACQDALQDTDDLIRAMRRVVTEPARESWWSRLRRAVGSAPAWAPAPVAAAAVLASIGIVFMWRQTPVMGVSPVSLAAMRGDNAITAVPANHLLELDLNATALEGDSFRVDIVDAGGSRLWSRAGVRPESARLRVRTEIALDAGIHWVRIYGRDDRLLREFGLQAR